MRHCINESVDVWEGMSPNAGDLLSDAAKVVDAHDGPVRVMIEPTIDPDNGDFTYLATAYLH